MFCAPEQLLAYQGRQPWVAIPQHQVSQKYVSSDGSLTVFASTEYTFNITTCPYIDFKNYAELWSDFG